MASRPYQIIVWSATGFVGKLICERILQEYQGKLQWAAAGRSKTKLERLKQDLADHFPAAKDIPLIIADAVDSASLENMASQTKVLLSVSGPYAKYGSKAVAACVSRGTHWCDLTGEVFWIKDMIAKHHDEAVRKGVKVVHACGFDSIPADLGALYMASHIRETLNRRVGTHEMLITKMQGGGPSGGTVASLLNMLDSPKADWQTSLDAYSLDPPSSQKGPDGPDNFWVGYSRALKSWTIPSLFQTCDNRMVRRSNALLGYGSSFSCKEAVAASNPVIAVLGTLAIFALLAAISIGFVRRNILRRVLPKPGQGPSRKAMLNGGWEVKWATTSERGAGGEAPVTVRGSCRGPHDAGYWDTSTMILEAAICLATQEAELSKAGRLQGGVLTPASALGMVLIHRLAAKGFQFSTIENS